MPTTTAVRVELVPVTPALARQWLGRNAENQRLLRGRKVDQYARDMAAGHWPVTGDTVKVTADNTLIDGQHRMAAVVQADTTVPMLIAYGVDPAVMPVLDTGTARSFADVLRVSGSPNRNVLGAIVRRVVMWERGNYMARVGSAGDGHLYESPTHSEMLERYSKDPGSFDAAAARGDDARRAVRSQAGPAGTAFYLFAAVDHEDAHAFFDSFISGANLGEGNPVLALRNRMTRVGRDERLTGTEQMVLFIRAWNAYREGRLLDRVHVTSAGRKLNNTTFPMPR